MWRVWPSARSVHRYTPAELSYGNPKRRWHMVGPGLHLGLLYLPRLAAGLSYGHPRPVLHATWSWSHPDFLITGPIQTSCFGHQLGISGTPRGCQSSQLTPKSSQLTPTEIPRGARSGRGPADHFDAQYDGWTTETYPRGKDERTKVPLLGFAGPQMAFIPRATAGALVGGCGPDPQSADLDRALSQRAPTGPSSTGTDWALSRRAPTGPSVNRHRPGPQSACPDRALSRRAPGNLSCKGPGWDFYSAGHQSVRPGRTFIQRTPAGPSVSGSQLGFQRAGPAEISVDYSRPGFHTVGPVAGPSVSGPQRGFFSCGLWPDRIFIRLAPDELPCAGPG